MKNQKRIVIKGDVKMDTVTVYSENQIKVEACPWMSDMADGVAPDGRLRLKGCTTIEPGAQMVFRPYKVGSQGRRYELLFKTEHCEVMRTQTGTIIEKWRFEPSMTSTDISKAHARENVKIEGYYQSRKEETVW
ncbi:MAG: hypothetical protein IKY99_06205 [Bacteroidaceae bacterium]|nr:hypothetical protein [Bacteroidaceae bacterium]MBR5612038.1 hypothetical protein [Bacteroidaceae bacterium]